MIKAVLFDMDGVLVDAKEWHYQAFNEALRVCNFLWAARSRLIDVGGDSVTK